MGSRAEHLKGRKSPLTYHGAGSCPKMQSEGVLNCAWQPSLYPCLGILSQSTSPHPFGRQPQALWVVCGLQFSISSPPSFAPPPPNPPPVIQAPALGPTHLGIQFLGFLSQLLLPHYLLLLLAGFILLFCFLRTVGGGCEAHTAC